MDQPSWIGLLLDELRESPSEAEFLQRLLEKLSARREWPGGGVVRSEPPHWRLIVAVPAGIQVPVDLAADALDSGSEKRHGEWLALPMGAPGSDRNFDPTALLIKVTGRQDWASFAEALAAGCRLVRDGNRSQRRAARLELLLEITREWAQTDRLDTLLHRMAEAATRLFDCDRATIFLWDQRQHLLIGRPALGMENDELRLSDNAGVVGRVVKSGESERVDRHDDRRAIHGDVDKRSGYTTETILCVPMRTPAGDMLGAFELLNKRQGNFTSDDEAELTELALYAAVALANTQEWERLLSMREQMVAEAAEEAQMVGDCASIVALRSTIRKVADTDLAVLVLGENGTGKEVVAQSLHYASRRRAAPFVAVNCAALAETLLESELFGHEKGAFTDARETRAGKFEVADGGTLLLDEIGDMSLGGQAKLLRVLEEKTIVRVGGHQPIETDVRVVAATNQDLTELVRQRKFREDLYFRLNVVSLELPPLRERGDDVLLLAEFFLRQHCRKQGRKFPTLTAAARKRLLAHRWPGNVRELRNLMERVAYLTSGPKIDADDLSFTLSPGQGASQGRMATGLTLQAATNEFQSDYIRRTIEQVRGNVTEAARLLEVHRSNLYRKMRSLGMEPGDEP